MINKKGFLLGAEGLLRLILAIVLVFIAFTACSKLGPKSSDQENKYILSFEDFVSGIDSQSRERTAYTVEMGKKSAIIGFSKDKNSWKCENCPGAGNKEIFKPTDSLSCKNSACVCLCKKDFRFEDEFGVCNELICIQTTQDFSSTTKVMGSNSFWKDGFLIVRDIENGNGLPKQIQEDIELFVDNPESKDLLTICTLDMREYNKDNLGYDGCTE
jgi:hypothetical protein